MQFFSTTTKLFSVMAMAAIMVQADEETPIHSNVICNDDDFATIDSL